jgi:hypothetical protein
MPEHPIRNGPQGRFNLDGATGNFTRDKTTKKYAFRFTREKAT